MSTLKVLPCLILIVRIFVLTAKRLTLTTTAMCFNDALTFNVPACHVPVCRPTATVQYTPWVASAWAYSYNLIADIATVLLSCPDRSRLCRNLQPRRMPVLDSWIHGGIPIPYVSGIPTGRTGNGNPKEMGQNRANCGNRKGNGVGKDLNGSGNNPHSHKK